MVGSFSKKRIGYEDLLQLQDIRKRQQRINEFSSKNLSLKSAEKHTNSGISVWNRTAILWRFTPTAVVFSFKLKSGYWNKFCYFVKIWFFLTLLRNCFRTVSSCFLENEKSAEWNLHVEISRLWRFAPAAAVFSFS